MDPKGKKSDDKEPKTIPHDTFCFVKGTLYAVSGYLHSHKPECGNCGQADVGYTHTLDMVTKALKLIEDDPAALAFLNERT